MPTSEQNRRYYLKHRDRIKKQVQQRKLENPVLQLEHSRAYRRRNRELCLWRSRRLRHVVPAYLYADPCAYCGTRDRITIDHIEPAHLTGIDHWSNFTAACKSCNSGKRIKSVLHYLLDKNANN